MNEPFCEFGFSAVEHQPNDCPTATVSYFL